MALIKNMMKTLIKLFYVLAFVTSSSCSFAHSGHVDSVSFMSGLLHPLTGWDHFLAILLASFWSAFALKKIWVGPVLFMSGMGVGAILGLAQYSVEWFELGIAFSITGLGVLIYVHQKSNPSLALGLIGLFGFFHGYAHADALSGASSAMVSSIAIDLLGLLVATAVLHGVGVLLANKLRQFNQMAYKGVGISATLVGLTMIFVN